MTNWGIKAFWLVAALFGVLMAINTFVEQSQTNASQVIPLTVGTVLIVLIVRSLNVPGFGWLFTGLFSILGSSLNWLFFANRRWEGARYMDFWESTWFFKASNKGWLVDGKNRRLSERVSYQSVMVVGGVGKGKTSGFVMPNLLSLNHCSLVITDTSGEIHDAMADQLRRRGYAIKVLNLMRPSDSDGYNPLHNLHDFTDVQKVAHLIVKSSSATGASGDQFWTAGAEKIIRILIQCLKHQGDPSKCNLRELKRRLNQFDHFHAKPGTSQLNQWVLEQTIDDPTTWQDYKGFIAGNEKTVSSFITTADTALMALGNPALGDLTSRHEIDFAQMRNEKTALFVLARQQDLSAFSFLLNLFYTDLCRTLLNDLNAQGLPVYMLLDEFGHLTIPAFTTFAATARKYRVAFMIFLQSLSQLDERYGRDGAKTIVDSLQTEIYLSGQGIETAEVLSRRLGRKRRQVGQDRVHHEDINLMNPDEIIAMADDEVLLVHSNKRPTRYRVTPFYKR